MSAIKLSGMVEKRHPDFGNSYDAKNKLTKTYALGDLTIKFKKEEWYAEGDTDAEFWIEIGGTRKSPFDSSPSCPTLRFDMFPDEPHSRMSMGRGKNGCDQVALVVTEIEDGQPKKAVVEEGSAREMNREWIALARAGRLSAEDFTACLVEEFGVWWFGGCRFLPKLAAKG